MGVDALADEVDSKSKTTIFRDNFFKTSVNFSGRVKSVDHATIEEDGVEYPTIKLRLRGRRNRGKEYLLREGDWIPKLQGRYVRGRGTSSIYRGMVTPSMRPIRVDRLKLKWWHKGKTIANYTRSKSSD